MGHLNFGSRMEGKRFGAGGRVLRAFLRNLRHKNVELEEDGWCVALLGVVAPSTMVMACRLLQLCENANKTVSTG